MPHAIYMYVKDLPALRAISTIVPIFFCCVAHNLVMRRGSIVPSDRQYWLKIKTSVCLISKPNVHFGQNFFVDGFFTSDNRLDSRGDGLYSADISKTFPFFTSLTAKQVEAKTRFY